MKIDSKVYYENMNLFLQEFDYIHVASNLKKHILNSSFIPKIADLVKEQPKEQRFNIPSVEETRRYLISLENDPGEKISPENKKLIDERIKAILSKDDEMEW